MEYSDRITINKLGTLVIAGLHAISSSTAKPNSAREKSDGGLVTKADMAASEAIIEAANHVFRTIPVHSEERQVSDWLSYDEALVVDPLDGTTNFVHGLPFSSVSVALVRGGVPIAGVVAPLSGGWYFAAKGSGSYFGPAAGETKGAKRLRYAVRPLNRAVLNVSCDQNDEVSRHNWWDWLTRLRPPICFRLRIIESAAMELCWLASGHIDGYLHPSDKPWDLAAGALIAAEAGVELFSPLLTPWELSTPGIIALTPRIAPMVRARLSG